MFSGALRSLNFIVDNNNMLSFIQFFRNNFRIIVQYEVGRFVFNFHYNFEFSLDIFEIEFFL